MTTSTLVMTLQVRCSILESEYRSFQINKYIFEETHFYNFIVLVFLETNDFEKKLLIYFVN